MTDPPRGSVSRGSSQRSRAAAELPELVVEAWLERAPKRLATAYLDTV